MKAVAKIQDPFEPSRLIEIPLVTSADPGNHRGYAICDPNEMIIRSNLTAPLVLGVGTTLRGARDMVWRHYREPGPRANWSIVEYQYTGRITDGEISARSIVSLAFKAGWMLHEMRLDSDRVFAATPSAWKPYCLRGGESARKDIFCNRIKRQLLQTEKEMLAAALAKFPPQEAAERELDVLDAIGIGWALGLCITRTGAEKVLRDWHCRDERITPNIRK